MKVGASVAASPDARSAAIQATMEAAEALHGERPDLAVVFASPHFAGAAHAVIDAVHEAAGPDSLIGCVGESVIGPGREIEGAPAVSVWLATLPYGAETFRASFTGTGPDDAAFAGWPEDRTGHFLLLCDPFSFPAHFLLNVLNQKTPGSVVVGGMASGPGGPGDARLFLDRKVVESGAVGARLPEAVDMLTLVSQGCRPVGNLYTVTAAEGNLIFELGGQPAVARIKEMFESLEDSDKALMGAGLHIGRVIDEYKQEFVTGDFLIRPVMGADPQTGAIAVGDLLGVGETVQFHVRDAASADEDLRATLTQARASLGDRPAAGALLFTCNGRGSRLFSQPDHDAALLGRELAVPAAGFFCAGEFGPVGGKNWLHGFTASIALFLDRQRD